MILKELFDSGISFGEEFDKSDEAHREKAQEYMESMKISEEVINKVKSIDKKINILGFSELWCPDCQINLSVMNYLTQLNENINLKLQSIKGNEEVIKEHSDDGRVKVPLFIMLDKETNKLGAFVEVPSNVRKAEESDNQVERIVAKKEYRKGKYMEQTILDFLDIIENGQ
ncbi:MAG: thioredoxin family protein [Romboutsia sp.]